MQTSVWGGIGVAGKPGGIATSPGWTDARLHDPSGRRDPPGDGAGGVDVPFLPLGEYLQPTASSTGLEGMLKGTPLFWNVERTA